MGFTAKDVPRIWLYLTAQLAEKAQSYFRSRYYLLLESFFIVDIASCTVVMNCAGKMIVEFFSVAISAMVWSVRSLGF